MANHHTEQKRILLKAALISLVIHGAFIALFTSFYKDSKVSQIKKLRPINIELVEKEITKTVPVPKAKPKVLAQEKKNVLPPKPKPIVNQNVPTPTRQPQVNVEKKLQRNQPTDSSSNQTKISKPNRNIGTNAQKKQSIEFLKIPPVENHSIKVRAHNRRKTIHPLFSERKHQDVVTAQIQTIRDVPKNVEKKGM